MQRVTDFIITCRWFIIVAFIAATVIFAAQLPKARMNPDMLTYLPEDMESRIKKAGIEKLFGGTELVMLLVESDDVLRSETLHRVKELTRKMKRIEGIDKVMSVFELKSIKGEGEMLLVNPAVEAIPVTEAERQALREELKNNDLVYGNVISKDFTLTAVIGMVETGISDQKLIGDLQRLISATPGSERIYIGGTPYSRYQTSRNTARDLGRLLPLGLLVMLVFLYLCFRQLRGVFLPFLVVLMSIVFAMGLIPLLGWRITVITIILPILLIAVANDYGIHLIARCQEIHAAAPMVVKEDAVRRMLHTLWLPILLTGVTTVAGMLCLQGHILLPAGQLGILAAAGIVFALAASLLFIPAVISLLPNAIPLAVMDTPAGKRYLSRLLAMFGRLVTRAPKAILIAGALCTVVTSAGIHLISVNTDPVRYYEKDHEVAVSATLINRHLGGFFSLAVVFEGDIRDPRLLSKIDGLEREIEGYAEVGTTMSVARVVRQMSRVLNSAQEVGYDRIPQTRTEVAQYFELYMMSGDPGDFEKMVDFDYEHAVLMVRLTTSSTPVLRRVVDRINERVSGDADILYVGGIADVFSDLSAKVVTGQLLSLSLALVAVVVLLMLVFRSASAGMLGAVPLVVSTVILFGLMGYMKIELNVATALLSSIMIGVGIDYTIHFLWRYREERQNGNSYGEAARCTLQTTGRGIVFNALSVIVGFAVLLFSGFVPVRFFGFLVVVSIFSCLIGALVVVPALCILCKPGFLEPKGERVRNEEGEEVERFALASEVK